jgi:Phosphodiester glycosidase
LARPPTPATSRDGLSSARPSARPSGRTLPDGREPSGRHGGPAGRNGTGRHTGRRGGPGRPRRNWAPHLPKRRWSRIASAALIAFLIPVSWSVGHALTMPGAGSASQRLAEWARDHYLGPLVTLGEWMTYQPPKVGGKPSFALTGPSAGPLGAAKRNLARDGTAHAAPPPPPLKPIVSPALPGEGAWRVLATVSGQPAIYGTDLRPSRLYSSYVAGIVSINENLVRFELRPGSEDPGPGNWHALDYIAPGTRAGLLATFNSGFKIASSDGGFYLNGATTGTLEPGVASEVYYSDGRLAIGVWDKTVRMTPDVVGVRQNLHLIVQNGQIPASVNYNVEGSWGATLGGGYYVWRSGIGITADNRVIFGYGPALNVRELAGLLKRAGAVTAMELDINPDWTDFMYYLHLHGGGVKPVNMLPDQMQPADRYLTPASRDFTAVFGR